MYPYNLGYYIKYKKLVRIPKDRIPVGCVKIIKYRLMNQRFIRHPYNQVTGELMPEYWSIYRWYDLDRIKCQKNSSTNTH